MISAAAFALIAPVALQHRVATVDAVVRELAQKSGRSLGIRREMADEVLYVGLGPHDVDTTMRLVAHATCSEWIESGGTVWLARTGTLRRRLAAMERKELAQDYSNAVGTILKGVVDEDWSSDADHLRSLLRSEATRSDVQSSDEDAVPIEWTRNSLRRPLGRLFVQILKALPATEIGALPVGETARFSSRPRLRQGALTGVDAASLRRYAEDRRGFVDDLRRLSPDERQKAELRLGGLPTDVDFGTREDLYALLTATRFAGDGIAFELGLYNAAGRRVDSMGLNLTARPSPSLSEATWRRSPLRLSPSARSFYDGLMHRQVDPVEAGIVRDPVAHDPLETMLGDAMKALGEAWGGEAIVALPDETSNTVALRIRGGRSLGAIDDALRGCDVFETEGGVRVGRPRRPESAEATKLDRAVFRDFLQTLEGGRHPGLDATANYALRQNPNVSANQLEVDTMSGAGYWQVQFMLGPFASLDTGYRDFMRVYGSLSPERRHDFRARRPIPLAFLSEEAKAELDRFVFRRLPQPQGGTLNDPSAFVDGLPADGSLTVVNAMERLVAERSPIEGEPKLTSVLDIASQQYERERGEANGMPPDAESTKFVLGGTKAYLTILRLTPRISLSAELQDFVFDPKSAPVSKSEWPSQYLKEYRRVYDYLKGRDTAPASSHRFLQVSNRTP